MTQENQTNSKSANKAVVHFWANPGNYRTSKIIDWDYSNQDLEIFKWNDGNSASNSARLKYFNLGYIASTITDVQVKIVDFEGNIIYAEY